MSDSHPKGSADRSVRGVLLALGAVFVAFGVAFLLAPGKLAGYVDLEAKTKLALIELRAFYGGAELGLGVFLAAAALRRAWHVPALTAALLTLVGVAGARIYGISVEGSPGAFVYVLLAVELAGVVAATFGLAQARRAAKSEATSFGDALEELASAPPAKKPLLEKTRPIERTKKVIDKTEKLRVDDD